jgi:hypothetical protein
VPGDRFRVPAERLDRGALARHLTEIRHRQLPVFELDYGSGTFLADELLRADLMCDATWQPNPLWKPSAPTGGESVKTTI